MKIYTFKNGTYSDGQSSIPDDMANADRRRIAAEVLAGAAQIVAYVPTKTDKKQVAIAAASVAGFSIDQLRILRAIVLLATSNATQKANAQAFLAPLIQMVQDYKNITDLIDADAVPPVLVSPTLPAIDP